MKYKQNYLWVKYMFLNSISKVYQQELLFSELSLKILFKKCLLTGKTPTLPDPLFLQ